MKLEKFAELRAEGYTFKEIVKELGQYHNYNMGGSILLIKKALFRI